MAKDLRVLFRYCATFEDGSIRNTISAASSRISPIDDVLVYAVFIQPIACKY
jgi:hypothetical protein